MEFLDGHPNSFDSANRVWCFNHTLQLSVKALLKAFGAPPKDTDDNGNNDKDNEGGLEFLSLEDCKDDIKDEDEDEDDADDEGPRVDCEDGDEEEDLFDALDEEEHKKLEEDTLAVRSTLNKVCTFFLLISCRFTYVYSVKIRKISFTIIHSTTIALPAWRKACTARKLPILLIPCDVKTCWNLTYDMVKIAYKFCPAIDHITANKSLNLHKYELDNDDRKVIGDLLQVLKVCFSSNGVLFRC